MAIEIESTLADYKAKKAVTDEIQKDIDLSEANIKVLEEDNILNTKLLRDLMCEIKKPIQFRDDTLNLSKANADTMKIEQVLLKNNSLLETERARLNLLKTNFAQSILPVLCADYRAKKAVMDEIQKDIDLKTINVDVLKEDKKLNTKLLADFKNQFAEIKASIKPNNPSQHTVLSPEEARQNVEKMDGLTKDMLSIEQVLLKNSSLLETAQIGLDLLKTNFSNHNHELVIVYRKISGFYWENIANSFKDTIRTDSETMKKIVSLYNAEARRTSSDSFAKEKLEKFLGNLVITALFNEHDIPKTSGNELTGFIGEFIEAN